MRRNLDVDWSSKGRYSTDVFTEEAVKLIASHDTAFPLFLYLSHLAPHAGTTREPFQAPDEEIAKFSYIRDPERRVYAGNTLTSGNLHITFTCNFVYLDSYDSKL